MKETPGDLGLRQQENKKERRRQGFLGPGHTVVCVCASTVHERYLCNTPHFDGFWRGMCNLKWGKREEERSEVEGGGMRVGLKRSGRTGRLETGDTGRLHIGTKMGSIVKCGKIKPHAQSGMTR